MEHVINSKCEEHTISDYYYDLDELRTDDDTNLKYWSEYQCKVKSLKTYFSTQLECKVRYLINTFQIPEDYFIEFSNFKPINGKLTQQFVIWNESFDEDSYSYVCIPKNQSNDGFNNKASLHIFKNSEEYVIFEAVNFLEMKQKINKKILNKDRDMRYFKRKYKKHKAKEKLGVVHKTNKKYDGG